MDGGDILYELGKQVDNAVIYTIDEWRQIHAKLDALVKERDALVRENARLERIIQAKIIAMKHNAAEDIRQLSKWIGGIHVKDRNVSGENVILGRGLVDFKGCFQALKEIKYEGSYILETSMGDNPIETAKYHLGFVKELLDLS